MSSISRQVIEGAQVQGVDEAIVYSVSVLPVPSSVISVKVYDMTDSFTDVTSTVMPTGSATISGGTIVLPRLTALTEEHAYRVEVRYSDGTNTLEPYFLVRAER